MNWLKTFQTRLRALFRKRELDADMDDEMRSHIEMRTQANIEAGMNPEEARFAALRQFGWTESIKENCREQRGVTWLENLVQDIRYGARQLRKNPGFTAVAVLTLALGIGLNLVIFAFANSMLFRPLPGIRDASQLVLVKPGSGTASYPDYCDFRDRNSVFTELATFAKAQFSFSADNLTERIMGEIVTANYFRTLGVSMAAGREFLPDEDRVAGRDPVVVISHRLWQRRWNLDPAVVGRQVVINGHAFTIVGVAPEQYRGCVLPTAYDLWVPIHSQPLVQPSDGNRLQTRESIWLGRFVGRMKPTMTIGEVRANVSAIAAQVAGEFPDENRDQSYEAGAYNPFGAAGKPRQAMLFLGILTAICVLVLAVVCANVANLVLTRALAHQREVAIRLALGSSRWRLVRQALAEGLIIALLSAALGMVTATAGAELLFSKIPGDAGEPVAVNVAVDHRVVGIAVALAIFSAIACALLPALRMSRLDLIPVLKSGEGSHSARGTRLRSALVVIQVALCAVLLTGVGLLLRSLQSVYAIDPRLRVDDLLVAKIDPGLNGYERGQAFRFYEELLPRIRALPGVEAASLGAVVPLSGGNTSFGRIHGGNVTSEAAFGCNANIVGPDYFYTTGIPSLRGREFSAADRREAPRVAIVNQTLADKLWADRDALGQMLFLTGSNEPPLLVVGVVSDSIYADLARESKQTQPFYYLPSQQRATLAQHLFVRTMVNPTTLLASVRQVVREMDPHLPLFHIKTLKTVRDEAFWQQRLALMLVSFAGWVAILLAMLGLYAVIAQQIATRTREIGIRMAIGARRGDVLSLVLREGMKVAGLGIVIGFGGAFALGRVLRSLLLGVGATDPITFLGMPLLLMIVALLACWLPARRAAKINPMEALRCE